MDDQRDREPLKEGDRISEEEIEKDGHRLDERVRENEAPRSDDDDAEKGDDGE